MATATRAQIDTVTRIPIGELIVDSNIRRDTKMKPGFAANVKQHGVLEPVDAYQDDNGAWHLQDGQLRYLASLDAGHPDIPVLVQDPALAEAAKLIKQLNKNQQRSELTEADEANAWQSLFELGVSADAIAKKTNRPRKIVEQALDVNQSEDAKAALEAGVGLDRAAIIAEFRDSPALVGHLTETALTNPTNFNYLVEQSREVLEEQFRRQNVVGALLEAGVTIIESPAEVATAVHVSQVYRDDKFRDQVDIEAIPAGSLRAAIEEYHDWVVDEDSGRGRYLSMFRPAYYVEDPDSIGLFVKPLTKSGKAPLTEKESAERKKVIANNKAWPIAATVRRQWIADELLNRTSLPSDIVQFAAFGYAGAHPRPSNGRGGQFTREWLSLGKNSDYRSSALIAELIKKPGAANKIILAIALGDAEEALGDKEAWRGRGGYGDELTKISRYLEQLASWGHNLSDVEAEIVKEGKK